MSVAWWVVIGLAVIGGYAWYAAIVRRKHRVMEALAGIDVQLQQRHDLIPNVLTIARRFMDHERELLTAITDLRTKAHQQVGEREFADREISVAAPSQEQRVVGIARKSLHERLDGFAKLPRAGLRDAEIDDARDVLRFCRERGARSLDRVRLRV